MLVSFLFLGLALVLAGCDRGGDELRDMRRFSGSTMGTYYSITVVAEEGEELTLDEHELLEAIDAKFVLINEHMSTYIDDSELMMLNAAPVGEWLDLSEPMARVLAVSEKVSERSEGRFDITVMPLVNLWGFGPDPSVAEPPPAEAIEERLDQLGFRYLELDGEHHRLRKNRAVTMDLSGVAKGYGADWMGEFLASQGFDNYLVEIGGDIAASGVSARGDAWRIAIEQPSQLQQQVRAIVNLSDVGLATSGDYRNYFERDGRRYSHTIDPLTGYPIDHRLASVSVIAPTAAEADAWSTAIMVAGPDAGMALAELEQLAIYMIIRDGDDYTDRFSSAFSAYLEE
ncbi:FAD:protein FMN transferase [Marinimicrobium alkaliphilum]|uniref:FAD:protein FMN transferase n=1 Tax=Marinimicrobium alkaliphilum TaxID=2202654 RepID=UPI001E644639|nr:FAD:protein FMN transferase [Marinimicrobium alkaliphilum]